MSRIDTDGPRFTANVRGFVDVAPSWQHPGLYHCEVYLPGEPLTYFDWHAVQDDFGNLVRVYP
jgi:hypothetical protein